MLPKIWLKQDPPVLVFHSISLQILWALQNHHQDTLEKFVDYGEVKIDTIYWEGSSRPSHYGEIKVVTILQYFCMIRFTGGFEVLS